MKASIIKRIVSLILIVATLTVTLSSCKKSNLKQYEEDTSTEEKDVYYVAMDVKYYGVIIQFAVVEADTVTPVVGFATV